MRVPPRSSRSPTSSSGPVRNVSAPPAALAALKASFTAADLVTLGGTLGLCALTLLAEWRSLSRGGEPYSLLVRPWVLVLLVVLTVWLAPGDQNDFIYFAF